MLRLTISVTGLALLCTPVTALAQCPASFAGLGDLPGGAYSSSAFDVSDDGNVVVGSSKSATTASNENYTEAFRWKPATGMIGLGDIPTGDFNSSAHGVSGDGMIIVGSSSAAIGPRAFRWTDQTGMVNLHADAKGDYQTSAWAVSDDGSVIVGTWGSAGGFEALRWHDGEITFLPHHPGSAISADGRTIVGTGVNPAGQTEAFRVRLGLCPADITGDGSVGVDDLLAAHGMGALPSRAGHVRSEHHQHRQQHRSRRCR